MAEVNATGERGVVPLLVGDWSEARGQKIYIPELQGNCRVKGCIFARLRKGAVEDLTGGGARIRRLSPFRKVRTQGKKI